MDPYRIFTQTIPQLLNNGGSQAIILLLMVAIAALWFERRRLLSVVEKEETKVESKDQQIINILKDYNEGNRTLTESFNQIRITLAEIKGKV